MQRNDQAVDRELAEAPVETLPLATAAVTLPEGPSPGDRRRQVLRSFLSQPPAAAAALFILLVASVAVFVWLFDPLQPNQQDLSRRLEGPSRDYIFGTDHLGRDVFARMLHGTRISLLAVLQGVAVVAVIGVPAGLISGYARGRFDAVMARIADAFIIFPGLILAIAIIGALGPGLTNAMFAIGLVLWPGVFRVVRGAVFSVREEAYIAAARTMGASHPQIILKHVLPNVLSPLLVILALFAAIILLVEAALSFLGLGVQAPAASWGAMIRDGQRFMSVQPWMAVFPGLAITLAAMSFNLISDGLSRALSRRGLSVREG